jgi:phosphatidylglycerophosphate synthase
MISLSEVRRFKHRINPTEEIEGRGSFGYFVARPISVYLTWMLLQTPLRANHVTTLHLILGILGSALLGHPSLTVRLGGCALLYVGFVLDNVDGEIARFRKEVSVTGKYLDTVAHTIVNSFMFFCFGFSAFWDTMSIWSIVLGFLGALFCLRIDVFAMYTEAAKAFKSNLDSNYEYYANIESRVEKGGETEFEFVSKRADSRLTRVVFAAFAYPGSLHIITITLLLSLAGSALGYEILMYTPAIVSAVYGVLLPLRRIITIRRIVVGNQTESQIVELRDRFR